MLCSTIVVHDLGVRRFMKWELLWLNIFIIHKLYEITCCGLWYSECSSRLFAPLFFFFVHFHSDLEMNCSSSCLNGGSLNYFNNLNVSNSMFHKFNCLNFYCIIYEVFELKTKETDGISFHLSPHLMKFVEYFLKYFSLDLFPNLFAKKTI